MVSGTHAPSVARSARPTAGPLVGPALWLDPCGGMAGDMFLAGLLDLQDPRFRLEDLQALADELLPGEAALTLKRVQRQGLAALHLDVRTPETVDPPHRHLADLLLRIDACHSLEPPARARARAALVALAEAEGRVHGMDPEQIHFHEVGAVDTLIDVCGAALALQNLACTQLFVRPPLLGSGVVHCAHGELPVPPPATAQLLLGLPVRPGGGAGERVTPTGAAILASWGVFVDPGPVVQTLALGYGAGTKDPGPEIGPANLLRVSLIEPAPGKRTGTVWQIEVNLDDITGQDLGASIETLWRAGALDVWTQSIQMKKQRPGTLLGALVAEDRRDALAQAILASTPTLGLRWWPTERIECERRVVTVRVHDFDVRIKERQRPGPDAVWEPFPEFEDLRVLAEHLDIPLWSARHMALDAWNQAQRA